MLWMMSFAVTGRKHAGLYTYEVLENVSLPDNQVFHLVDVPWERVLSSAVNSRSLVPYRAQVSSHGVKRKQAFRLEERPLGAATKGGFYKAKQARQAQLRS